MKVLLANKFFFEKGGAEKSLFETARLLEDHGHEVCYFSMQHPRNVATGDAEFFVSEVDYEDAGVGAKLRAAGRMLYSFEARQKLDRLLDRHAVDVAHLNNIYHQISPSILHTLKRRGVPTVLSLRDYKVVCGSYQMLTSAGPCEACKGGRYYQGLVKRCMKGSVAMSLLTTLEMYLHHSLLGLYQLVDIFISPSAFLRDKVLEMGFKGRVVHLPNCADVGRMVPRYGAESARFVYFGRLGPEKGLHTLIEAMKGVAGELDIIGEGPERKALEDRVSREGIGNVRFLGYLSGEALERAVSDSLAVVLPSEWYENNPRSVIEAFALGKPVVGARIGGIPELVRDGDTGLTFTAFDPVSLRDKLHRLLAQPGLAVDLGRRARRLVEDDLNPERHHGALMEVYRDAIACHP